MKIKTRLIMKKAFGIVAAITVFTVGTCFAAGGALTTQSQAQSGVQNLSQKPAQTQGNPQSSQQRKAAPQDSVQQDSTTTAPNN